MQKVTLASTRKYEAPRNETEQLLVGIWQQLLGIGQIGIYDNFFELGGHSLLVMRMAAAIRNQMNLEVSVKDIFQLTTIEAIARYIKVNQNNFPPESAYYEAVRL